MNTYYQSDEALRERIEHAYVASENDLGWRFLMSPPFVLNGADIAFIGLNPGGSVKPNDHAEFAMSAGSAYEDESWAGSPPGRSPLQRQVLLLFKMLGTRPDEVLSGNLVPFRSPSWDTLSNKRGALRFGCDLWRDVIDRARPRLIVSMSSIATEALSRTLNTHSPSTVPVGWGRVSAKRFEYRSGTLIGLPHLSRFGIVSRAQSQEPLRQLFGEYWAQ
ncbi:MAG: hypothetical protein AcusKO_36040 [Acuticoccus sp.]